MPQLLQTVRLARPALPMRVAVTRPSTMFRGYPAGSQTNDADPKVRSVLWISIYSQARKEEKDQDFSGEDKISYIIDHAPGWDESLASYSEALASSQPLGD